MGIHVSTTASYAMRDLQLQARDPKARVCLSLSNTDCLMDVTLFYLIAVQLLNSRYACGEMVLIRLNADNWPVWLISTLNPVRFYMYLCRPKYRQGVPHMVHCPT